MINRLRERNKLPSSYEIGTALSVVSAASQHSFGSYTEINASAAAPVLSVIVSNFMITANNSVLFKIAKGSAGNEVDVVEFADSSTTGEYRVREMRIDIPAGERTAIAVANITSGVAVTTTVYATLQEE